MHPSKKAKRDAKIARRIQERKDAAADRETLKEVAELDQVASVQGAAAIPTKSQINRARKMVEKSKLRAESRSSEIDKLRFKFYPEYRYFIELHQDATECENVGINNLTVEGWGNLVCYDCKQTVATLDDIKQAQREMTVEKAEQAADDAELGVDDAPSDSLNYLEESMGVGDLDRDEKSSELR